MKAFKNIEGIIAPIQICSYKTSKNVKIYVKDGYIKITKPIWYSQREVLKHVEQNKVQINKIYNENNNNINNSLLSQGYLLYLGKKYKLNLIEQQENKMYIKQEKESINIYLPKNINNYNKEQITEKLVKNMYKKVVHIYISKYLDKYCKLMNIELPNFRIKDCKTRWGSCSSNGNLNFNIKLGMLPSKIIEQVVVHELCHLKQMNHSEKFWNLVFSYYDKEQYIQGKKWIRDNISN